MLTAPSSKLQTLSLPLCAAEICPHAAHEGSPTAKVAEFSFRLASDAPFPYLNT